MAHTDPERPIPVRITLIALLTLLTLLGLSWAGPGHAYELGQLVQLNFENPDGVPLHRSASSSMFDRAHNGSLAEIIEISPDRHWLRVRLRDSRTGWVIQKYLHVPTGGSTELIPIEPIEPSVWDSPEQCESIIATGARMGSDRDDQIRIATWNIRWFPVGNPRQVHADTDLDWLACTIGWMNLDLLAIQESLATPQADTAWALVLDRLSTLTHHEYRIRLNSCSGPSQQHVGLIWNADTVDLDGFRDEALMNGAADRPDDSPCTGNLRPGLSAYARSAGMDFHIVVVHADSGTEPRDYQHRQTALARVPKLFDLLTKQNGDPDLILLGDFNTMGAQGLVDAQSEIEAFRDQLGSDHLGLKR